MRARVFGWVTVAAALVAASAMTGSVAAASTHGSAPAHIGHAHVLAPSSLGPRTLAPFTGGQLVYHGGPVMTGPTRSIAIFWEPSRLQSGARAAVSVRYNRVLTRYLTDVGGKGLYGVTSQYSGIRNASTLVTTYRDTSRYPASKCPAAFPTSTQRMNCLTDAQVQAEVRKVMKARHLAGGLQQIFFVFLSRGEYTCINRSACFLYPINSRGLPQGYCAYHSYFPAGSRNVVYADMPYGNTLFSSKAGTSRGLCASQSVFPNDRAGDIEASMTSHEQLEAVTDPLLNAWWDSSGMEVADKCAYDITGSTLDGGIANELWAGHFYALQTEWDNATESCVPGGSFSPSPRSVARGSAVSLTGVNYTPGATLTVTLKDSARAVTVLGTVSVGADGSFTGQSVTIPAGAAAGAAAISLSGPGAGDGSTEAVTLS
ncbi:MAG TPA: hypothetical protein VHL51_00705 [Gaiellales bacterium]|nr:hypothetical protein [Gaiellales bacterium]